MVSTSIDYTRNYSEHSKLGKIHGKLAFHSLKPLQNELKVNLSNVSSKLGGGNHEHLDFDSREEEEEIIAPGNTCVRPEIPGPSLEIGGVERNIETQIIMKR